LTHLETHGDQQGLVVLADHVLVQHEGAADKELTDVCTFWTCVEADDCSTPRSGRFAPMLHLYPCCPLMITENVDVGNNMAKWYTGCVYWCEVNPWQLRPSQKGSWIECKMCVCLTN
jgi:hypothetical protein